MYYLGFDIGGTKTAVSLGKVNNNDINIIFRKEVKTTSNPIETLKPLIKEAKELQKNYVIISAGISCGGPLDSKKGIILCPPSLPGWENFPICKYLKDELNLETYLENDANACAVAEHLFGAGIGVKNMVFITFGTGFGAGLIIDNKLYSGANDNAGEIGHIRLTKKGPIGYNKEGSLEGWASGGGIARLAKMMVSKEKEMPECVINMGGIEKITTKSLAEYAHKGDKFAKKVFRKSGKMLGKGLAILIDIINPELIVIGGVFMRSGDLLIPSMKRELKKECLSYSLKACKVVPAKLSENIGDYAAISIAIRIN